MRFILAVTLPLAVYILVLSRINRGRRALVLSGPWDFLGVLLGSSGFLIFGGVAILQGLNETWRRYWLLGEERGDWLSSSGNYSLWIVLFAGYFLLVVVGAAYLLRKQRRVTSIYNVDPEVFATVLSELLGREEIRFRQHGNYLHLTSEAESKQSAGLEVEPSPRFRHVTLRWTPENAPIRQDLEAALEAELASVEAPDNPAGDWMLLVSGMMFLALVVDFAILCLHWYVGR